MRKFWRIFSHEYTRHVLRKRFLIGLFGIPLGSLALFAIVFLVFLWTMNFDPVGYVDQAGIIQITRLPEEYQPFIMYDFLPFPDEAAARAALDKKEIQAFFVLSPDYRSHGQLDMYYRIQPMISVQSQFTALIRVNLLDGAPDEVKRQVINGPVLVTRVLREEQAGETSAFPSLKKFVRMFMPWGVSGFLLIAIMTTSGYLLKAMVDEKENRMMEILATCTRPEQIMHAKIVALILVGLTQLAVWGFLPGLAALIASRIPVIADLLSLDWNTLLYILATALPTFVIYAAIMAAIGASLSDTRDGQNVNNLILLMLYIPFMAAIFVMNQPNGVIAMILSFFPLTASITLLLRMGVTVIPGWQIWLSAGIVLLSAAGSIWLAGCIFRWGMLRYGKPLVLKNLVFRRMLAFTRRWLRRKGTA